MSARLTVTLLAAAEDESVFGGKAVSLGAAIRAGLPVPAGVALAASLVDAITAGDAQALSALEASTHIPEGRLAVRSSAIGEDSADASFAGQHLTRLNVRRAGVAGAVRDVWESGRTPAALAYRARKGLPREPRIAVVVQLLIEPIAAGVLFTRNPVTGADERMIEAAWGLGEAVVNGAVVPDRYRLDPSGRVLDVNPGDKDLKIWYGNGDGTVEIPVADELRTVPCLERPHLEALHRLAEQCRGVWGPHLDIEWAIAPDGTPRLLQCRPITT